MGTIPIIKSATLGPRTFDSSELGGIIALGGAHCSTSGRYNTLRKPNGTAGYSVTTGKTLTVIVGVQGQASTAAAFGANFFYADNDSGSDSTTTPTNPVYLFGDSYTGIGIANGVTNGGGGAQVWFYLMFNVPAGKYLGYSPNGANCSIMVYCTEA